MDQGIFILCSGLNPIIHYVFFCKNCSRISHWELFHLVPEFFWHTSSSLLFFFNKSLLSGTTSYCRIILSISCPGPRISHFSKGPWSPFFTFPEWFVNIFCKVQNWKNLKDLLILEWVNILWIIHTMGNHTVMNMNNL